MPSQIDAQLEKLITLEKITDSDMDAYLGGVPEDLSELIDIVKNIRNHIRIYGRKSDSLENYIETLKKTGSDGLKTG